MTIFITSDTHFGHANIIQLCQRPFDTVEEMDETMIESWNDLIAPEDTVWHLGDFAYKGAAGQYFNKLNGKKHLIIGNHDGEATLKLPWQSVSHYVELNEDGRLLVLFHYPIVEWRNWYRGAYHFHGHQHNHMATQAERRIDVGVDAHDGKPWELKELMNHTFRSIKGPIPIKGPNR